jgi:hypothetical protein
MRLILATLLAAVPANAIAAVLTPDGFGPLKIGMTRSQVEAIMGKDASPGSVGGPDPAQCDQFHPRRAPPGLLVMLEQGRLTRISIARNRGLRSADGIGVGFRRTAVLAKLGKAAQLSPHQYEPRPAVYIDHWRGKAGTSRGIRYEIGKNGQVAMIHAGGPSIRYVEGCL